MDEIKEWTADDEIAALEIMTRNLKERLDYLKSQVKHELLSDYAEHRSESRPIFVGDKKVGSYIVVDSMPQPTILPGREDEAIEFLQSLGLTKPQPIKHWEDGFVNVNGQAVHMPSGSVCDAIEFLPSKAPYIRAKGFKPDDVRDAFQARGFASGDVLALIGGQDV